MKYGLLAFSFFFFTAFCYSQNLTIDIKAKPSLDLNVFNNWTSLYRAGISNNGEYVYFTTRQNLYDNNEELTIKCLSNDWKVTIPQIKGNTISFSNDSKYLYYLNSDDSLCLVLLGTSNTGFVPSVQEFKLLENGSSSYLIYQLKSKDKELIVRNLKTNSKPSYKNVAAYIPDIGRNALILKVDCLVDGQHKEILLWNNLADGTSTKICDGNKITSLVLSKQGDDLAFIKDDSSSKAAWHYKQGSGLEKLFSEKDISSQLEIGTISAFSKDGSKLLLYVKEKSLPKPDPRAVKLDVYSFTDAMPIKDKSNYDKGVRSYLTSFDFTTMQLVQMQNENHSVNKLGNEFDRYIYATKKIRENGERYWNNEVDPNAYFLSIDNKTRRNFNVDEPRLSPDGNYIIGRDANSFDILSYDLVTNRIVDLTKGFPFAVPTYHVYTERMPDGKIHKGLDFSTWAGHNSLLFTDEFDIWLADLEGKHRPLNITNGVGRQTKIVFRPFLLDHQTITIDGKLILTAFERVNKRSGFYQINLGKRSDPQLLTMDDYYYTSRLGAQFPIKAQDKEIYLVQRESATESPNLYWTSDFKTFNRLSSIFPERNYNWLTAELKSFKTVDGRTEQGILYKPENFDTKKKYPVIIHYYQNKSDDLNKYQFPGGDGGGGELDIAWFVSHEYLVFTPDIHYKFGETGRSAYHSVVGAANYLKTLPFIDPKKMALQGHSFGGYETNYLVANSHIFTAAVSSSGLSNLVTEYLSDNPGHPYFCEMGQLRIGCSLWDSISLYIENSPVFKAYNVTTPILTIANKHDGNVPFIQGSEWFMALRRLGKRVWMLQYDDGGHGVEGNDYIDYIIRSTQFFDHYLKDSACPSWMLYGIPGRQKGIDDGLQLVKEKDSNGKWLTPIEGGLLTEEQKKKVKVLQRKG